MVGLLWKEMRSSWWMIALAMAAVIYHLHAGDWLFFNRTFRIALYPLLYAPFVVMGLQAYSTELEKGTIDFLYSTPIKWWQVLLAKMIPGLVGAMAISGAAALICPHFVPETFRPFVFQQLVSGALIGAAWLAGHFLLGLSVSVLCSGMTGALLSLVFLCQLLSIPFAMPFIMPLNAGSDIGYGFFMTGIDGRFPYYDYALAMPLLAGMIVSCILAARRLPHWGVRARWRIWLVLPLLILLGEIALVAHNYADLRYINRNPRLAYTQLGVRQAYWTLIPDESSKWKVVMSYPREGGEAISIVDRCTGRVKKAWHEEKAVGWEIWPEGNAVVYVNKDLDVKIIRLDNMPRVETLVRLQSGPRKKTLWHEYSRVWMSSDRTKWESWGSAQQGGRLAIGIRYKRYIPLTADEIKSELKEADRMKVLGYGDSFMDVMRARLRNNPVRSETASSLLIVDLKSGGVQMIEPAPPARYLPRALSSYEGLPLHVIMDHSGGSGFLIWPEDWVRGKRN